MTNPAVNELSPAEAARALAGGAFLLDVREPEEWGAGHAPEAYHIALGELGARVEELPASAEIIVVCRVGGRSMAAAQALVGAGYNAVNLAGGMVVWAAEGYAVVADGGAGIVV